MAQLSEDMIACITRIHDADLWRVRCYDGTRVLEVLPPDPHVAGWPDYQDAYDALFAFNPFVTLIGPESWIFTVVRAANAHASAVK